MKKIINIGFIGIAAIIVSTVNFSNVFAQSYSESYKFTNNGGSIIGTYEKNINGKIIKEEFNNDNGDFCYFNESYYTTANDNKKHTLIFTVDSNEVIIDGTAEETENSPYIKNSTAMLPLRTVTDTMKILQNSINISWNSADKSIKINYKNDTIIFKTGENQYTINDKTYNMEGNSAEIKDGRVYIPLRTLAQAMGLDIQWDNINKTITIAN